MRWPGVLTLAGLLTSSVLGCGRTREAPSARVPAPPSTDASAGAATSEAGGAPATGLRLEPWQLEADGVAPLVLGTFDTAEQVHCEFLLDSEGQLRCLPTRLPDLKLWELGDHEDQNCAYLGEPTALARYDGRPVSVPLPRHGCEQRYAVATLSVAAEPESSQPLRDTCAEESPGSRGPTLTRVTIASVLSPERWVAASLVDGPALSARLHLRQVRGDDGSTFDDRVVDDRWGAECEIMGTDEFPAGCVPPYVALQTSLFTEAACAAPLWALPACAPATYLGGGVDPRSGAVLPTRALGEVYEGPIYRFTRMPSSSSCELLPAVLTRAGTDIYYQGGDTLFDTNPAPFSWRWDGAGRLRRRGLESATATFINIAARLIREPLPYQDSVSNTACAPLWTTDGSVRCVPTTVFKDVDAYGANYYADAQCTQRAYFCALDAVCGSGLAILMDTNESAAPRGASLVRTTPQMGTYQKQGDSCVPDPSNRFTVTLGEELPWTEFAELTERNGAALSAP